MTNVSLPVLISSIPIFIFAVIIHEVAHGWAAYRLGDPTAKYLGRLTLNPIPHIDPVGTVILPILLMVMNSPVVFGWAKSVPINFLALRNPKKDIIYVGLAGPLANIIFAFILTALFRLFAVMHSPVLAGIVFSSIVINLFLAAFNLIPLPPLDGSRILFGLLPARLAVRYMSVEKYGFIILFILIWLGFIDWFVNPMVSILAKVIGV